MHCVDCFDWYAFYAVGGSLSEQVVQLLFLFVENFKNFLMFLFELQIASFLDFKCLGGLFKLFLDVLGVCSGSD